MPAERLKLAILIPPADYSAEWRWAYDVQADALIEAGAEVEPVDWTDERDLAGYDLVLPLVAWGYHKDYAAWLGLLDRLERQGAAVENALPLLRWNGDKSYLPELGAAGIPTVPTLVVEALDERALEKAREKLGSPEVVVKPPISASAFGTYRLGKGDPVPEPVRNRRMLVQPWVSSITGEGEYSLIFFAGAFSHCVSKVPIDGEFRVQPEYGGIIRRCPPPPRAVDVAQAALGRAPSPATYARADLVVGNGGDLEIIELELIEPALFLDQAPDRRHSFAAAVFAAAERSRK